MSAPVAQAIVQGFFETPNDTPTGKPKKIAVVNPYLQKDSFVQSRLAKGLGITTSSDIYTSGELDQILLDATNWANEYCGGRYFDVQTIDETKTNFMVRPYNPQLVSVVLRNRPYRKVNSIYIQVLRWFIQVDTTSVDNYLQDFSDLGFLRIVPLLSTAGTGVGTPIPAAILDRIPLGVLWTNYTFGFGQSFTAYALGTGDGATTAFQAPLGNRLWAPDQTFNVYLNGVLQATTAYTVDYPNGKVTFNSAPGNGVNITIDFTTNESIPGAIRRAVAMYAAYTIAWENNAIGAGTMGIQTYNVSFKDKNLLLAEAERLLEPYTDKNPIII